MSVKREDKFNSKIASKIEENILRDDNTIPSDKTKEEIQDELMGGLKLENERIEKGFRLARDIFDFQKREMKIYRISITFLLVGEIALLVWCTKSSNLESSVIITAIVSIVVETMVAMHLMIKHTFSNQLKDIIQGLYTHKHYFESKKED